VVEVEPDRQEIVVRVRVEGPVLVPLDRRAVPGGFHVELAGLVADARGGADQRGEDLRDLRAEGDLAKRGMNVVRLLDPTHPRLVGRVSRLQVIGLVVIGDLAGGLHQRVDDLVERVELPRGQDVLDHEVAVSSVRLDLVRGEHLVESSARWLGSAVGRLRARLAGSSTRPGPARGSLPPAPVYPGLASSWARLRAGGRRTWTRSGARLA